jgi:hypothetical protein
MAEVAGRRNARRVGGRIVKGRCVRFLDASAEARSALAALYPWSPDLQVYWDRPFMDDDDFAELVNILAGRRKSPLKRHPADYGSST